VTTTLDLADLVAGKDGFTAGVRDFPSFSPSFSVQLSAGDTFDYTINFAPGQQLTIDNLSMIWAFSFANVSSDVTGTGNLSLLDSTGAALYTSNTKTDTEQFIHFGQIFYASDFASLPTTVSFSGLHYVGTVDSYSDPGVTVRTYDDPAFYFNAYRYTVTAVPEPETYALMLAGLGLLGGIARRRRTVQQ
jgi:hypothetical protein